jgi:hypothetical protein
MKQLFKEKELIGKTISKTYTNDYGFWVRFSDDSFVVFESIDISSGFEYSRYVIGINKYDKNNTHSELVKLGLITQKEYEIAVEEEDREFELRREKQNRIELEETTKREKELLEKLKSKYDENK